MQEPKLTSLTKKADRLVRAGDLVSNVDIATKLNKSPQVISSALKRYPEHAPDYVAIVGQSRVYLWPEIQQFWEWYINTPHNHGGHRGGNRNGSGVGRNRTRAKVKATPLDQICRMPGCNNIRWRNSPFCQKDTYAIKGYADDAS